mgnify:FL=1
MLSKTHTKYIQSLQHKKFRDQTNLFIAETPKLVIELVNSQYFHCKEVFFFLYWIDKQQETLSGIDSANIFAVQGFELANISALSTAHDVLAVFEKRKPGNDLQLNGNITIALDAIQDPGNLGTIIRIADWFGIKYIICGNGTADMYSPKVVQSTMGSLGRVNIIYTDLPVWLSKNKQVKIYAASLDGKDIRRLGKLTEGIIIIGNEANGISDKVLALVNENISIYKTGRAESLNAAVATGIILSHIK